MCFASFEIHFGRLIYLFSLISRDSHVVAVEVLKVYVTAVFVAVVFHGIHCLGILVAKLCVPTLGASKGS